MIASNSMQWYEDEDFWRDLYPYMFPAEKFSAAEEQVSQILSLTAFEGGPILDLFSKEIIARGFSLTTSTEHPDGSLLVGRRKIRDGWSRVANEWILIKEGQARSFRFEHTIYSGRELRDRLVGAGFADVKLSGDLAGRSYDWEAKRLVVKATKP